MNLSKCLQITSLSFFIFLCLPVITSNQNCSFNQEGTWEGNITTNAYADIQCKMPIIDNGQMIFTGKITDNAQSGWIFQDPYVSGFRCPNFKNMPVILIGKCINDQLKLATGGQIKYLGFKFKNTIYLSGFLGNFNLTNNDTFLRQPSSQKQSNLLPSNLKSELQNDKNYTTFEYKTYFIITLSLSFLGLLLGATSLYILCKKRNHIYAQQVSNDQIVKH